MKKIMVHLFFLVGCVCGLSISAFSLTVNPKDIQASRGLYYSHYVGSEGVAMNWTGDHASCNAGTTSQAYKDAVLMELKYFRAMAGVPTDVTFLPERNAKAQEAALMMSVNRDLSHYPPTSWKCYTIDGAEAARRSNLGWDSQARIHPIDRYIRDKGVHNYTVGHRRWILYPQTKWMGTGDVPSGFIYYAANALWVVDYDHYSDPRPKTREDYVAWPPPGYAPYQVVYPRWSFSYDDADFGNAKVTMTKSGGSIPVVLETYAGGRGENTLVWRPFNMPDDDTWPTEHLIIYTVTVSNVLISGNPRSFTYTVVVFDPANLTLPETPIFHETPEPSDDGILPAIYLLLLGEKQETDTN